MAPLSFDILGSFFNDSAFTVTATIASKDYTVIRMQRDDSKKYTADGVASDVAFSIIVKVADKTVSIGSEITIDSVIYRAKEIHLDGAGLTQRVDLVQRYG
jgi:hypothetical protein